jgi:heptose-I-phosphate ethanolaminephosphotransferase
MKILNILSYPIRSTGNLFSFCILMELVILTTCHIVGVGGDIFLGILMPIFDCYVICLLASLFKKVKLGWIIWTIAVLVFTGELFTILFYKSTYNIRVIQLVMETTPGESKEFLASACGHPGLWISVVVTGIVFYLSYLMNKNRNRLSEHTLKILNWTGIALILWSSTREIPAYIKLGRCFTAKEYRLLAEKKYMPHLSTTAIRLLQGVAFNIVQPRELNALTVTAHNTPIADSTHECPLIVLIIGESFSKYHTPLYNPDVPPVNPRLERLKDEGHLVAYTDVVTTSNLTSNVMRNMFSMWDEDYSDNWTEHTLFPAIFRKAGYTVWYLTNQFALNSSDIWNSIGGTIFNKPELSECLFDWRNENLMQYDAEILDLMPDTSQLFVRPTLLIVHLMGQHVNYKERYPEEFEFFDANQMETAFGGAKAKKILAEYANATLYNDYVVDKVWSLVKEHDAVGIYLSDHGEEVYDWRDFHERTDERQMTKEVAKYQFEIPFMFLMSDKFITNHPETAERIKNSSGKPFINSRIKHVLLGLGGIETDEYKSRHDILSDRYDTNNVRYIGNHTDYDRLMQEK